VHGEIWRSSVQHQLTGSFPERKWKTHCSMIGHRRFHRKSPMAALKTKRTSASVATYLNAIADKQKRADCKAIAKMMRGATGNRARMWGTSIVGYGSYDYKYASGREGTWSICGFSPRAQNIVIYIMPGFSGFKKLMNKLGKYKTGKSCLYIKKLADVDQKVLEQLIDGSVKEMRRRYK